MRSLKNFINLNVEEKYRHIEKGGIFLSNRIHENRKAYLYYFSDLFCEVWILDLIDHNERVVTDIKLFKSIDYLEPYLNEIDIKNLY